MAHRGQLQERLNWLGRDRGNATTAHNRYNADVTHHLRQGGSQADWEGTNPGYPAAYNRYVSHMHPHTLADGRRTFAAARQQIENQMALAPPAPPGWTPPPTAGRRKAPKKNKKNKKKKPAVTQRQTTRVTNRIRILNG